MEVNVIPFQATLEAVIGYPLFKPNYYTLSDEHLERISISELNDHYYDAEETCSIVVNGAISMKIQIRELENPELSDTEIFQLIRNSATDIDSIDEIQIEEEVLEHRLRRRSLFSRYTA